MRSDNVKTFNNIKSKINNIFDDELIGGSIKIAIDALNTDTNIYALIIFQIDDYFVNRLYNEYFHQLMKHIMNNRCTLNDTEDTSNQFEYVINLNVPVDLESVTPLQFDMLGKYIVHKLVEYDVYVNKKLKKYGMVISACDVKYNIDYKMISINSIILLHSGILYNALMNYIKTMNTISLKDIIGDDTDDK
jgi:hypothetical protein